VEEEKKEDLYQQLQAVIDKSGAKDVMGNFKGDLYIVMLVEKEVSHYWKYGYQQYNAYSFKV
jgi:hypothetical protein